ncbi:hypothetical protein CLV24_103103 [Pontibacter ummariensis]|uniref:Uncharacterized protein n=1 Tax=Pontibacter ummariensis TaxID=1610492 RepID=A0A239CSV6_9BACT|nr:hypothetical protein [Pontibacter ummariensis]PRY14866.1 hypothetical protein CLV24_103103 [Pontibacter ummariensis]SNS22741.1 hypothetical protein SAMN06296052_103210 [Pontibacter ummariensis]
MKIIVLLFAMLFGLGANVKKSADDLKEISKRNEMKAYQNLPNLLPEVEIVAESSNAGLHN